MLTYSKKHYIISLKNITQLGICSILAELLKAKNINVPELAKRATVSQSTLYSIIKRNNLKVEMF